MKTWKSLLFAAGLLLAAVGLASGAAQAKTRADAVWQNVTLYLETPLSAEDAQSLGAQENDITFTVWTELMDQTVTDPDLGHRVQTDVLALYGSSELVLPLAGVLDSDDSKGCLIGEQTAWELFGSTEVAGDEIRIGNGMRTIRAVVHLPQSGVVVRGNIRDITSIKDAVEKKSPSYNRITIESRKVADGEAFLMQNGLNGKVLRLDYLKSLYWLTELVPGKWSDFSGWKENFKQKKQDCELISGIQKNSIELYYESQCRLYVWNMGLEIVCIVIASVFIFRFCYARKRLRIFPRWSGK